MNLKRLLDIAQEADKIGDYVTADKVTNLLKTAQGQYSVYPNQAAYFRTPQQSQQMLAYQQNQNIPANQQMPYMPQMNQQMPSMPQMNQQMPQQGGVYNPGIAPGATIYTPGVVNVAQPQMTDEQKAFAKLRGTGIYQSLSKSNGVMDQRLQAIEDAENKARQSRIYYGPAAGQANPNASMNPNLYGTGYASMAMNPQLQPQPPYNPQQQLQQQPQQQPQQQQYPYNQQPNQIR